MRKKIILGAAVAGAVLAGALSGALHEEVRSRPARPVLVFVEESQPQALTVPAQETPEAGEGSPRPEPPGRGKKPGRPGADLGAIKKGISPISGAAGDMKDYLDEADRKRAERIRKSLEEIKKKVRDWHPNIFEPTW